MNQFPPKEPQVEYNLAYFTRPGTMTDPGAYAKWLDGLPAGIGELCRIVQGCTVHVFWAGRYGLTLSPERKTELQLRSLARRLGRMAELDDRPLVEPRPLEKRTVGTCRDFALLLVSLLRHQGVPARARCGFGVYFLPNHFEDHWVAEYWNQARSCWVLVDPQLDPIQCQDLKIGFDPCDVPRDEFVVGGMAWKMCREGRADPDTFGIHDMHGLGFVRGDFVRDVAALNKTEMLPWDCWGLIEHERLDDPQDLDLLDRLAALTEDEVPRFHDVRSLYVRDVRLRVPGAIHSWVDGNMQTVKLRGLSRTFVGPAAV